MAYNWDAINAQAMQGLQPQQPGLGQQIASKAATKLATDQVAKLGLGAAGTAIGGPLGGAVGQAAGELAGPLAGNLVAGLFNEGGPVPSDIALGKITNYVENYLPHIKAPEAKQAKVNEIFGKWQARQPQVVEAPVEEVAPEIVAPRTKASAQWNVPLGEAFGADWSTHGSYADRDMGEDPWSAGVKGVWRFESGGEVNKKKKSSIWGSIANKVKSDFARRKHLFGGQKKPQYKAIGGLTKGPLGISDMQMAGKDKTISKVKLKKNDGTNTEEVELNYHPPLKPKGE